MWAYSPWLVRLACNLSQNLANNSMNECVLLKSVFAASMQLSQNCCSSGCSTVVAEGASSDRAGSASRGDPATAVHNPCRSCLHESLGCNLFIMLQRCISERETGRQRGYTVECACISILMPRGREILQLNSGSKCSPTGAGFP